MNFSFVRIYNLTAHNQYYISFHYLGRRQARLFALYGALQYKLSSRDIFERKSSKIVLSQLQRARGSRDC